MVGSSKILTVSYGTFSCTLEGFDDSFSTMQAIAEYFRDLAADDRYFGAEPPTPDAEMLARIAEREVARRVEARTENAGIVLKAGAAIAAAESAQEIAEVVETPRSKAAPEVEQPDVDTDEDVATEEAAEIAVEEAEEVPTMPPAAEAPIAPAPFAAIHESADTYEEDEEPVTAAPATEAAITETEHPDANSVAAKLQRIRAVVSRNAAPAIQEAPAADFDESLFADTDEDLVSEDEEDTSIVGLSDLIAEDAHQAEDEDTSEDLVTDDAAEDDLAAELEAEADVAEKEDETSDLDDDTEELESSAAAEIEEDAEEATAEAEPVAEKDETPAPVRARVIRMRRSELDIAVSEGVIEEQSDIDMAEEADDVAEAVEAAELIEDDYGTSFDDLGQSAEAAQEAEEVSELDKLEGEALAEAAMSTLTDDAEADLQAELAALTGADDSIDVAEAPLQLDTPISDAVSEIADAAEEAEDDVKEEDEPEQDSAPTQRPRRVQLPGSPDDDEVAMTRIMSETEAQMSAPETSRRRDAIAQLKAAVAATEAAREMGEDKAGEGDNDEATFRDDLRQVVRPTRPIRPSRPIDPATAERAEPAPLKLVASQRVDVAAKVAEDIAAEQAPEAAGVSEATGFAAFAEDMGAQDLSDLLEAAAAYTSFVEGAEDFSRPQLMSKVKELSGADYSREDGLRSFGTLLRQGRINKVRNGRFQISGETRFHPERRAG